MSHEERPMRTTTDTYTGKRFRWNDTTRWRDCNLVGPTRMMTRSATQLHPSRVPLRLLRELNPGVDVDSIIAEQVDKREVTR